MKSPVRWALQLATASGESAYGPSSLATSVMIDWVSNSARSFSRSNGTSPIMSCHSSMRELVHGTGPFLTRGEMAELTLAVDREPVGVHAVGRWWDGRNALGRALALGRRFAGPAG